MTSNAGKKLDRLEKLLDQVASRKAAHHFVVVDSSEDEQTKLATLHAEGKIRDGDDVQVVRVAWRVRALVGQAHIPEGSDYDPLSDPRDREKHTDPDDDTRADTDARTGLGQSGERLDPSPDQLERWRKHELQIELDGDRYKGPPRFP